MTSGADPDRPLAVFLMGPTGAGKTDVAVELVKRLPLAIVSVDSALVYRGMDIGTAKPPPAVLQVAPHRLIDILDPAQAYSAARFRADALREMRDIVAGGRTPLLVGGTGLYFRTLEHGLSPLPEADPGVRRDLVLEARRHGWQSLHRRLTRLDPTSAARIHPNDPQRIQRALEVHALTGRSMTELHAAGSGGRFPYRVLKLIVGPGQRQVLHGRIGQRFHVMLEAGLVDEVAVLRAREDLHRELPAMRAVGYRQVWAYLDGDWDYAAMVERGIAATRQLAKRQLTWLRREADAVHCDSQDPAIVAQALNLIDSTLSSNRRW